MADWGQEAASAEALAEHATQELRALNPGHELLEYWFVPAGQTTSPELEEANRIRMKERFWNRSKTWQSQPGVIVVTVVCSNYYLALREAIREEKAKVRG